MWRLYLRHVEAIYGYGYKYAMWRLYIRHVEAVYEKGKAICNVHASLYASMSIVDKDAYRYICI